MNSLNALNEKKTLIYIKEIQGQKRLIIKYIKTLEECIELKNRIYKKFPFIFNITDNKISHGSYIEQGTEDNFLFLEFCNKAYNTTLQNISVKIENDANDNNLETKIDNPAEIQNHNKEILNFNENLSKHLKTAEEKNILDDELKKLITKENINESHHKKLKEVLKDILLNNIALMIIQELFIKEYKFEEVPGSGEEYIKNVNNLPKLPVIEDNDIHHIHDIHKCDFNSQISEICELNKIEKFRVCL